MLTRELIDTIRAQFRLDWHGVHGIPHWERVRQNGLRIARETGADPVVVELFSHIHDARRENEGGDPGHGRRAAAFAEELRAAEAFTIDDTAFDLLREACTYHSNGRTKGDATILTCWDADRLDLGRVGIRPDPRYLCTEFAQRREILTWAYTRSRDRR